MKRSNERTLTLAAAVIAAVSIGCGSDDGSGTGGAADGGTSAGGTSGAGTSAGGTSAGGTSAGGTSAGGTSAGGTSAGGVGGEAGSSAGASGNGGVGGVGGAGGIAEGNEGIASKYPGDVGIAGDSDVIFADDFESYSGASPASELSQRWDAVYQNDQIRIATEPANVNGGANALEFTVPQQDNELSNATDKIVNPERDVLHLRYYSKFQAPFDVVGSSHNGSMISAHYFIDGNATPGIPADGMNKFLVNLENWRGEAATKSPGDLNVYVYHPNQRSQWGDHFFPSGLVQPNTSIPHEFGSEFVSRPDIIQDLDRWYCYEYMVQANTVGQRDGRIIVWLDGKLTADFPNLRFRDIDTLKIDRFGLSFHIGSNPAGETKKWYDDVVAATSYIGPKTAL